MIRSIKKMQYYNFCNFKFLKYTPKWISFFYKNYLSLPLDEKGYFWATFFKTRGRSTLNCLVEMSDMAW